MVTKTLIFCVLTLLLRWATTKARAAGSYAKPGCPEICGSVSVPYPFGIDDLNCAMDDNFLLTCDRNSTPPLLMFGKNIITLNISVEEGIVVASIDAATRCYNESGLQLESIFDQSITMGGGPFRFSDTRNKLTVFGCDTLAGMSDWEATFTSFCGSFCSNDSQSMNITGDSCSGIGCCQTPLPKSLKTLNINLTSIFNHSDNIWKFNPCDYAFLADQNFNISEFRRSIDDRNMNVKSNVTVEWVVKEANESSGSYVAGDNSNCFYSENGKGYRCLCKQGFRGNPYLQDGCEDIDECKEPRIYRCDGTCKNTNGNYTCDCPIGMRSEDDGRCSLHTGTKIILVIGAIILILVIGILILMACKERRKKTNFLKNGGIVLKSQRVRLFSEAELAKATKNYDNSQLLGEGGFGYVFKGLLPDDNIQIAVKKPKEVDKSRINQEFQRELGIVSQVNHRNIVKLLGLCLETKVPLLVYEFISNGNLCHHIQNTKSQILKTWKNRLRIATEIANALHYFHSLANPPIIHGDVKSANILLDENGTAKVSDFGTSVLISPGQNLMVTKIQGTFGYLDPEYLMTGILTEKSDVYSFGVVLVELLTGVKPTGSYTASGEKVSIIQYFSSSIENNNLSQVLAFEVVDKGEMEEIEIVAELAKRCLNSSGVKRPRMKEVAEELDTLKKLHDNQWSQENSEETEHLLGDSSYKDAQTVITLEIDHYTESI